MCEWQSNVGTWAWVDGRGHEMSRSDMVGAKPAAAQQTFSHATTYQNNVDLAPARQLRSLFQGGSRAADFS